MKNLARAMERHIKSRSHISSALKLKLFRRVAKKRDLLRKLIIAVLYSGQQEYAFHGHDESDTSKNKGNFVQLLKSFSEFDPAFAEHLKTSTIFKGTSKSIQNDIIQSIATVVNNEINQDVQSTDFFAIQADDTTNVSCKCQLSVIIGIICERFLGFHNVSADRDAETLSEVLMKVIQKYNPEGNVGAGDREYSRCFLPHWTVSTILFTQSPQRTALLTEADNSVRIPGGLATLWNFKSRAVNAVCEGRQSLIIVFD
ncbi:Zinc finger MYM-type protein 1 [Labeo rohita]|uniref:Zinc finger MYM-type protein 1 n=1 Tax=Labeo rohita TaxID=84645 RepID=A0ABQ8M0A4_LABRO|nr:Zinc finger MYM-type protein 1 [Labeo rohita]